MFRSSSLPRFVKNKRNGLLGPIAACLALAPLLLGGCVIVSSDSDSDSDTATTNPTTNPTTDTTTDTTTGTAATGSTDDSTGEGGSEGTTAGESTGSVTTGESSSSAGTTDATDVTTDATTDATTDTTTTTTGDPLKPVVTLETSVGDIVLQLDAELAPITTENFLIYVDNGFYDGEDGNGATIFHRVIDGFVMQGGGLTANLQQKSTLAPITNESGNGLTNIRGSIAMARTNDPNSATSQFYINFVDNLNLDMPPGYAVFGGVIEGLDVVDTIAKVETNAQDVPIETITILDAYQN